MENPIKEAVKKTPQRANKETSGVAVFMFSNFLAKRKNLIKIKEKEKCK